MKKTTDKKAIADFLAQTFLFRGISSEKIEAWCESAMPSMRSYAPGDSIYSPLDYEKCVGFVVDGDCVVERKRVDGAPIPLNRLKKYDAFGILSVFSDGEKFPTSIRARKSSEIIFISKEDVMSLVKSESQISLNIIEFMANRIDFLNDKISTFSSGNVEQKLVKYILLEVKSKGLESFDFNCKKTAESINSGRASLYRAIASLQENNLIKLENKKIYIIDREGLERISK